MKHFSLTPLFASIIAVLLLLSCTANAPTVPEETDTIPPPTTEEAPTEEETEQEVVEDAEDIEDVEDDEEDEEVEEENTEDIGAEAPTEETVSADPSQSSITFVGSKGVIVSHDCSFDAYDFQMKRSAGEPQEITLTIPIASIQTDSDKLTQHLLSEDFFESEIYPEASFTSTSIEKKSGNTYTVTGNLTIKGITNSVTFDADITESSLTMNYDLDRTQFGVGAPAGGVKSVDAKVPMTATIVFE